MPKLFFTSCKYSCSGYILRKILLFIYFGLWRNWQLFLIVILSFCLVLVSRINSIKNIANHCSALSFLSAAVSRGLFGLRKSVRKEKVEWYQWWCYMASISMTLSWYAFTVHAWLCFSPALLPQSNFISKSVCHGCLPCWEVLYHMFVFLPVFLSALEASPTCSTQTNSFDHFSGVWDLRCCQYVSADTYLRYVNNLNLFLLLLNTYLL